METFWSTSHSSQFCIISKLAGGPLHPGHWWISCIRLDPELALGNTTGYQIPTGLCTTDHSPLCCGVQPVINPPYCPLIQSSLPELAYEDVMGDCQKSCRSSGRQCPLLSQTVLPSEKAVRFIKNYFLLVDPCWILQITFFFPTCLKMTSTMNFSITFPRTVVRLNAPYYPASSFSPFLKTERTLAFLQSSGKSPVLHDP